MKSDMPIDSLKAALAPQGMLRAAINLGNKALVRRESENGEPIGVSPALARRLAELLGVTLEMVLFDGAGAAAKAAPNDVWDIAFLAIDPDRRDRVAFTEPYVRIEGTYAVRSGSAIETAADADREGVRILASVGSAYELHLRRTLRSAELVPADTPAASMQAFLTGESDAVAGVRQSLEAFFKGRRDVRVLPDRITAIEQAVAVPAAKAAAVPWLNELLSELDRSGVIKAELDV
jgi:polar amino acid transport system substrate-binding protein